MTKLMYFLKRFTSSREDVLITFEGLEQDTKGFRDSPTKQEIQYWYGLPWAQVLHILDTNCDLLTIRSSHRVTDSFLKTKDMKSTNLYLI